VGGDDCQEDERDSATDLMELDIISFDEEDFAFDNEGAMTFDPNGNNNKAAVVSDKVEIDPCCFNFDWCNRLSVGGVKQESVMPPQPQYYPIGGFANQQQQQQFYHNQQPQQLQQQQQVQFGAFPQAPNHAMNLQNRFPGSQTMPQRSWM